MDWFIIIVGIVAIFLVSKLIHFKHLKYKITAILLILLFFFAYLTIAKVISDNSINIKTASGVFQATKVYFSWLGMAFNNLRSLTGNVVNMDWFPNNSTSG